MKLQLAGVAALTMVAGGLFGSPALAETSTEVVTEAEVTRSPEGGAVVDNWMLYTRGATPPAAGEFVDGPATPPIGTGSFQTTTASSSDKVWLFNYEHIGTELKAIDDISYSTYRQAGNLQQVAALNLQVDYNGAADGGFTTLVFEPVYNTDQGAVVDGEWQPWTATGDGKWWSTKDIPGVCAFDCFVSWDDIVAANPGATISGGVGVNQGTGNDGLTSNVDAFTFNDVTYDFELVADADGDGIPDGEDTNSKDDCKDGGWTRFTANYKNQGQCVAAHNQM